jgi:hypothetical protein
VPRIGLGEALLCIAVMVVMIGVAAMRTRLQGRKDKEEKS